MSNASIDRAHSPTIQPEQGDEDNDGRARSPPKRTVADSKGEESSAATIPAPITAQMNTPFDQDLFDSRPPSQPTTIPSTNPPGGQTEQGQEEQEQEEPEPPYPAPASEEALLHPPDFKPFFTLVASPSGEHSHPEVHYLFSDDDEEILTSSALRALEHPREEQDRDGEEGEGDVEERVVIVDIAPDGKSVINVSSLCPHWQALRTEMGAAPSMGGNSAGEDEQEGQGDRGLMLRISGKEVQGKEEEGPRGLEELVAVFGARVRGLGEAVGRDEEQTGGVEEGEREEREW